jgi:hypothetical protein
MLEQKLERLVLSASGTKDPDGNKVTYNWFYYPEATSGDIQAGQSG